MMKWLSTLLLIYSSLTVFGQNGQIAGVIQKRDSLLDFKYLTIFLIKDSSEFKGAIPATSGEFSIKEVPEGIYSLIIRQIGFRDAFTDNIVVSDGKTTKLNLKYPPPCGFVYAKNTQVKCIGGHTDNIIPIVYGLPTKRTMNRAEKGLVRLAGCIISECDPQYYCKIHKLEL
ncbi:carboxypeptidase-like regulatory domain-containing protein [Rufibacter sp. XAAS-G3-1]|uniref:carboxypeptidase-like regulatory domain-containing protein n=1 Tax=Rufibacter sp. XAAS-G3-1 TaxID=2729134 RepID=UPI0015E74EC5|nr:carboxypeptidase-like regulatory domain-containing protein [Rufibacter sp. XAAS-G3-1]